MINARNRSDVLKNVMISSGVKACALCVYTLQARVKSFTSHTIGDSSSPTSSHLLFFVSLTYSVSRAGLISLAKPNQSTMLTVKITVSSPLGSPGQTRIS